MVVNVQEIQGVLSLFLIVTGDELWIQHHMNIVPATEVLGMMAKIVANDDKPVKVTDVHRMSSPKPIKPPVKLPINIKVNIDASTSVTCLLDKNGSPACSSRLTIQPWTGLPFRDHLPSVEDWQYNKEASSALLPIGPGFHFVSGFTPLGSNHGKGGYTVPFESIYVEQDPITRENFLPFNRILECVSQIGASVLLLDPLLYGRIPMLREFSNVKFASPFDLPRAGETVVVKIVEQERKTPTIGKGTFVVTIGDKIPCCQGVIDYIFVDPIKPAKVYVPPILFTDEVKDQWGRPLSGRKVLVTGGSSPLGRAIVAALTAAGGIVDFTFSNNDEGAQQTHDLAKKLGQPGESLQLDLDDPLKVFDWCEQYIASHGAVDILVCSAATGFIYPRRAKKSGVFSLSRQMFADEIKIWNINYHSHRVMCALFGQKMIERGWGRIVTLLSPGAHATLPFYHRIGPTKAALGQLTRECAIQGGDFGITANSIVPGLVDHTLVFQMMDRRIVQRAFELIRGGAFVRPEDVGAAVVDICLMKKYNGQELILDCGFSANQFPTIHSNASGGT